MTQQLKTLILFLALVASACAGSAAETPASSPTDTSTTATQPPETTTTTTSTTLVTTTTATTPAEGDPDALAWAHLPTDPGTGYPRVDLTGDDIPRIIKDSWAYTYWQSSDPAAALELIRSGKGVLNHPVCTCIGETEEYMASLVEAGVRYVATAADYEILHINLRNGSLEENNVTLYVVAWWDDQEPVDAEGNPVPGGDVYPGVANWRPGNPGSAFFTVVLQRSSPTAPWLTRVDRLEDFFPQDYEGPLAGKEVLLDGGKITIG